MANLFAVADRDPAFLDGIERRLSASGEFAFVWRPAPGWVAAQAPLPEAEEDGDAIRALGFAFVEGRDRLAGSEDSKWAGKVAQLADRTPARLAELPGDFGFLRFRDDGSVIAVRSCGGLAPMYVWRDDRGREAVGTLLRYFPVFLPGRFEPDPLIASAGITTAMSIDGRTFVRGVSILPRAGYAELGPARRRNVGTYWDPRPASRDDLEASPEHARELRSLLLQTLERDLDPQGRNLLTLSGGVDSSSVAALSAGVLGRHISSWSLIPPDEPGRSHELSYIDPLVSAFGIHPARKRELTDEARRLWRAASPGLPFLVVHPALCEMPQICAEQEVRVMVGGEFGDEVCGELARITDWVRETPLKRLITDRRRLPFGRRDYLRWTKRRLLDAIGRPAIPFPSELPRWTRPEIQAEYRDWLRRRRRATARDPRPLAELADQAAADDWVAMNWEGLTPLGIRRSFPFFNREVLELAFRCHPRELLGPGPKRLLRQALRDDVPARNLLRSDKGRWEGEHGEPVNGFEVPASAESLVRPDWIPRPPSPPTKGEVEDILRVARLAEYLHRSAV